MAYGTVKKVIYMQYSNNAHLRQTMLQGSLCLKNSQRKNISRQQYFTEDMSMFYFVNLYNYGDHFKIKYQ